MEKRQSNTREWLEECALRYVGMDNAESCTITVGEFRALVNEGFKMMDFADQLTTCQIEIQRLEKMTESDADRS